MARTLSKRVILWAASGPSIGMGHVVRTCAVAHALAARGGEPLVLVEDETSRADVRARGLACELAPAFELGSPRAAWLDGVRDWSPVVGALAEVGTRVLLVENRTPARERADLVIQPALHYEPDAWELTHPERVRGGPAWIPLAPEVLAAPRRAQRTIDLLVSFGGSDPNHSTEAVLAALARIRFEGRVVATLGAHMGAREGDLRRLASELPRAELRRGGRDFPRWIAESRLAVTALGTTLYELAHLGVRALVLANYDADSAALAFYDRHGPHLPLGLARELGPAELARELELGLARASRMPPLELEGLAGGAERIASVLLA